MEFFDEYEFDEDIEDCDFHECEDYDAHYGGGSNSDSQETLEEIFECLELITEFSTDWHYDFYGKHWGTVDHYPRQFFEDSEFFELLLSKVEYDLEISEFKSFAEWKNSIPSCVADDIFGEQDPIFESKRGKRGKKKNSKASKNLIKVEEVEDYCGIETSCSNQSFCSDSQNLVSVSELSKTKELTLDLNLDSKFSSSIQSNLISVTDAVGECGIISGIQELKLTSGSSDAAF